MKQKQKQLLLKDICTRLPYGARVFVPGFSVNDELKTKHIDAVINDYGIKPYLRPLSSMTNEEWCEYCDSYMEDEKEAIITHKGYRIVPTTHKEHFFNIHRFDYRGLIPIGLALEAERVIKNK